MIQKINIKTLENVQKSQVDCELNFSVNGLILIVQLLS